MVGPQNADSRGIDPRAVYILHRFPRICRFSLNDRTYSLFMGTAERHGLRSLALEAQVIATIRFKSPVPLDDALDAAWAWRRFFHQITMKQLPFSAISCRGRIERRLAGCAVYLPNLDRPTEGGGRHPLEFSPRDMTLGRWKDRTAFASVMKSWLERDPQRRLFRVRLDRALAQAESGSSAQIVAQLNTSTV